MSISASSSLLAPLPLATTGWLKRTPVILQTESSECGLACIAMVASYYGHHTNLATLRQQAGASARGISLQGLMQLGEKLHLQPRALKLDLDELHALQTPCILHWDLNHYVVLVSVKRRHVIIHDPALGKRSVSFNKLNQHFTGVALELTPTQQFVTKPQPPRLGLAQLWHKSTGIKRSLTVLLLLSLLLQIFVLVSPYYLQTVIDDVLLRRDAPLLTVLALGFGLLVLIETGTMLLRSVVSLNFATKLKHQLSLNVFRHLLQLPYGYFIRRHLGDIVSRFGSLGPIRDFLTNSAISAALDGGMAIITLVVLAIYDVKLALIVVGFTLVSALIRLFSFPIIRSQHAERLAAAAKENSHFMESVRGIQTIKLANLTSQRTHTWHNYFTQTLNHDLTIGRWDIGIRTLQHVLFGIEHVLIVYFAAVAVMNNALSIGMVYAFMSYKQRFENAVQHLLSCVIEFAMLKLHFERLSDIVLTTADTPTHCPPLLTNKTDTNTVAAPVSVTGLTYRHDTSSNPVFEDIHLRVSAGEIIAIVGPSGSGKTTLLKCLVGLLKAECGEVKLGENQTHTRVAAVMQDDHCFAGSLIDNIANFDTAPQLEQVIASAQLAGLHETIMAMPMQYQTLVGDMGTTLSGGQLQRLYLARALYQRPQLLLLDEASSHLDVSSEHVINRHLAALPMTRIIIAHRPETIAIADRVFELNQGRLIPMQSNPFQPLTHKVPQQGESHVK